MDINKYLETVHLLGLQKDVTRHCYTPQGRHESVSEHTWRMTIMAYFLQDEFPEVDLLKLIKMCLIHDIGEVFTGDIPSFEKTNKDEATEEELLDDWVKSLPAPYCDELSSLYKEMSALETTEARIYKALDNLEAVISHNESDLSTWIGKEYTLNLTYGDDKVAFSDYLTAFRALVREETEKKLGKN